MTAASPETLSEAWAQTNSLGRSCGSLYVSAVVKALESQESSLDEDHGAVQLDTQGFSDAITFQLLNTVDPRFGHQHDHRFEVQSGRWTDPYTATTGMPRRSYSERLSSLRTIPARSFEHIRSDRSQTEEQVKTWEALHPDAPTAIIAASNYGGSMMAVKKALRKQAIQYLKTNPGRDSLSSNIRDHGLIKDCITKPPLVNDEDWDDLFDLLRYRTSAISVAEKILHSMGISGPPADSIDMGEWRSKHLDLAAKTLVYHQLVLEYNLIPLHPCRRTRYIKAVQYIAAMCVMSGLAEEDLKCRSKIAQQSKFTLSIITRGSLTIDRIAT